jgi:uncharacterized protein (TIGR00266 family)
MQYQIRGTVMQSLEVSLQPGESVYTEAGGMSWMSANIGMETNMKGGLMGALKRAASGESLFMTTYSASSSPGFVTFTLEAPGTIIPMELAPGQSMICQRDAFMCAQSGVQLDIHFTRRFGAGLFGGAGFILQKVTGPGTAFFEITGEVVEYTLQPGQSLKVDPGHLAMMDPTVNFDITMVKGVTNVLFGGEGLFLADITGPGRVWLQTMPLANLAAKLANYVSKQ